ARRRIGEGAQLDPALAEEDGAAHQAFLSRDTEDAAPLPFQLFSSITSPRKLSSIVTSSGSLRKIWKSFDSGKLRKCISTLCAWMRLRTSRGARARTARWPTEPEPVVPLGCFFSRNW